MNDRIAIKFLKEPKSTRTPSKAEQILVLKASYLNGFKFPPWMTPPAPAEFELKDGEELFTDTAELPLAEFQEDVLQGWMRPRDALPPPSWYPEGEGRANLCPGMIHTRNIDLVQDAATDCSVVASLSAGIARVERGHRSIIINSVIFPHDTDNLLMSANGKYIICLNFNGCFRRVVIDDRLPVSNTSRVIHVVDRQNPELLWPALIEKAYLKVRGGYDFPGSNSGTDVWILCGWIPEQIFLQSEELDPDRFWKRIMRAFGYGDVLITMGTGKMSATAEKELGLAGEHDYAVLDLREEVDGQRLMLVKNPWCEGTSWRGRFAGEERRSSRDLLNADEQLSPGKFWMDLDNVTQHFESIYLNWNPGLFSHRQDMHFGWDLSQPNPRGRFASLARHPQFTITASQGGTIWVLLWRHFRNAIPGAATFEEVESDRYHIDIKGHITLVAFSAQGRRVLLPERHLEKGWFVDSPQTLLKLDNCVPNEPYTIVPLEQDLNPTEHTFTLSAFGNSPLVLSHAAVRSPHTASTSAAWAKDTAGGNAHSPSYSTNPQFTLTVHQRASISLLLEATNDDLNVHVKLVHSRNRNTKAQRHSRIHTIRSKDIILDSKDYRRGCCVAEPAADLDPGAYTVICSTFEPHQLGVFSLLVESTSPAHLALLPKDGAGRIRVPFPPTIFSPQQTATRLACPILANCLVKFYAIARSSTPGSLVRMTIELGRGPTSRKLCVSGGGEYTDSSAGLRIDDVDLGPGHGELWVVLERMSAAAGQEERFEMEGFVDQVDGVGVGEWRVWED